MPKRMSEAEAIVSFQLKLRERGIFDHALLQAFELTPRKDYLEERFSEVAEADIALPIPCGQTQAAPTSIARMITALDVGPGDRVLEIGTGSGYATALIARMALSVTTLERYRTLAEAAKKRLARPSLGTIAVWHNDGTHGYPEEAPYDRIILHGSIESEPASLIDQLTPGGSVVAILRVGQVSEITRWRRAVTGRVLEIDHFGRLDLPKIIPGLSESL
jgi:protein-L-isoaspartate(D-aspartate) O-methyltransferase